METGLDGKIFIKNLLLDMVKDNSTRWILSSGIVNGPY